MSRARLVLAGHQPLLLEAFRALLEPEFNVVATVTDGQTLLAECERLKPNVALVDTHLPLRNAAQTARQIRMRSPSTRVVLLTSDRHARGTSEAFRFAADFVPKSADACELRRTIRAAAKGPPAGVAAESDEAAFAEPSVPGLTERQLEVLQLLAEGRSMKEVATMLDVTPRTVAFHKYKMMGQLQVKTTAELVQFAIRHGVLGR
jgi:DNA-binding NarL/FixJ family response regulator